MKRIRTPQEKKKLSLKKDRRNLYGQNDKASGRLIGNHKRWVNRQNRKKDNGVLSSLPSAESNEELEQMSDDLFRKAEKRWQKYPDDSLADAIKHSKKWRILREGRKKRSKNNEVETLNLSDPQLDEFN